MGGVDAGDLAHFAGAVGAGIAKRTRKPKSQAHRPSVGDPAYFANRRTLKEIGSPTTTMCTSSPRIRS